LFLFKSRILFFSGDAWARAVARQTLIGSKAADKRKHMLICSEHFESSAYMCPSKRHESSLMSNAMPTLNLYQSSVQTPKLQPRKLAYIITVQELLDI
jgi:hypothetical protein